MGDILGGLFLCIAPTALIFLVVFSFMESIWEDDGK